MDAPVSFWMMSPHELVIASTFAFTALWIASRKSVSKQLAAPK